MLEISQVVLCLREAEFRGGAVQADHGLPYIAGRLGRDASAP
jgi:hypothetical protein